MYQGGELVFYGSAGVCRVEGLGNPDPRDRSGKQFYLLKPLYQDGVIYVPVDSGKVPIRSVISQGDSVPKMPQLVLADRVPSWVVRSKSPRSSPADPASPRRTALTVEGRMEPEAKGIS